MWKPSADLKIIYLTTALEHILLQKEKEREREREKEPTNQRIPGCMDMLGCKESLPFPQTEGIKRLQEVENNSVDLPSNQLCMPLKLAGRGLQSRLAKIQAKAASLAPRAARLPLPDSHLHPYSHEGWVALLCAQGYLP